MRKLFERINHVDCCLIEQDESGLLILRSRQKKIFNPVFILGIILFISSMFFKALNDSPAAAIPLGVSTLILISGVWILSGVGKIVFDKTEGKIYCVYKHLGYIQKVYVHSLLEIDSVELQLHKLTLEKDNGETILISGNTSSDNHQHETVQMCISDFIK